MSDPANLLTYENQWASDIYRVNGAEITGLRKVRVNGRIYSVTSRLKSVSYNDHGHTYEAVSMHYYIRTKLFGKLVEVDLNIVVDRQTVEAIEWSVTPNG